MLVTLVNPFALLAIITILLVQQILRDLTHRMAIFLSVSDIVGYVGLWWQIALLSVDDQGPTTAYKRCMRTKDSMETLKEEKEWRLWLTKVCLGGTIAVAIRCVRQSSALRSLTHSDSSVVSQSSASLPSPRYYWNVRMYDERTGKCDGTSALLSNLTSIIIWSLPQRLFEDARLTTAPQHQHRLRHHQ